MENKQKNLGLNCSTFEDFIIENRIYADKTGLIHKTQFIDMFPPRGVVDRALEIDEKAIFA